MATRSITRPQLEIVRPGQERGEEASSPAPEQEVTAAQDVPVVPSVPKTPKELQRHLLTGAQGENKLNVMLLIDGSDADGIRCYNEALPLSVIRALLDPDTKDFFIPIAGTDRPKPPRTKAHFLHTSYIREVLLLDELPEEEG